MGLVSANCQSAICSNISVTHFILFTQAFQLVAYKLGQKGLIKGMNISTKVAKGVQSSFVAVEILFAGSEQVLGLQLARLNTPTNQFKLGQLRIPRLSLKIEEVFDEV